MLFSKDAASTSAWFSIHHRGKKVVKASSGNTMNFAPMLCASLSRFFNLETAAARECALLSAPSWAAAILRCLAMALSDEVSETARGPVDRAGGSGHRAGQPARQILSRSAGRLQFAALDDDASTTCHDLWPALVDMTFVGRVPDSIMQHRIVDALFNFGVPDGDVGIGSDRDRALARVQAVHAGMVGRGERYELIDAEAFLQHALGKEDRQAHLDTGHAVGHLLERRLIAARDLRGLIEPVRCVIGGIDLEGAVTKPRPDRLLRRLVAQRRTAAPFRPFHAGAIHVLGSKH